MGFSYFLLAILLTCYQKKVVAEEDVVEFGLCPESHRFAFRNGQACCSRGGSLTQWTETSCDGDAIYCDTNSCEDLRSCTHCSSISKSAVSGPSCWSVATIRIENLSHEYDGDYSFNQLETENFYQEANRPIFFGEGDTEGKCIWWHHQYRHWWVGPCDNIGLNAGFAYIREDISCPALCPVEDHSRLDYCVPGTPITWRSGGSDEVLPDVRILVKIESVAAAGAFDTTESTSFVAVNAVIQHGTRYKQSCRFRYINGNFICVRKNGTPQG